MLTELDLGGSRRRPGRSVRLGLPLLLLVAPAANGAEREDVERWVPSVALSLGFLVQEAEGAVTSGNVLGPPLTTTDELGTGCRVTNPLTGAVSRNGGLCANSPLKLSDDSSSRDTGVAPLVEGSVELMTPRLIDRALSPRLFGHVDLAAIFGFERNLGGDRRPGRLVPPVLPPRQDDIPEIAIDGQGTRANAERHLLAFSAGAGLAFTLEVRDRTLRIKPSFEYYREEVDLKGELKRAVKQQDPANQFGTLADFRAIRLRATETEVRHALGGGLELEADSGRIGPMALSVFVMGRGYYFLGDQDYSLKDSNEFGETASWDYEFEPWAWRARAGIRFRWLPE